VNEEERMKKGIRSFEMRRRIQKQEDEWKENILKFLFSSRVGFSQP
jgi:hypothetical protein